MVIRIIITILFLILAIVNYRKSIIIEKEYNPQLIKDDKLNFLTSAIPYTLAKIFAGYVLVLTVNILLLQSLCTEKEIIKTYENISISNDYKANTKNNKNYTFGDDDEKITFKGVDNLEFIEDEINYIEEYRLISKYKIVNILMYGSFEKGLIVHFIQL